MSDGLARQRPLASGCRRGEAIGQDEDLAPVEDQQAVGRNRLPILTAERLG